MYTMIINAYIYIYTYLNEYSIVQYVHVSVTRMYVYRSPSMMACVYYNNMWWYLLQPYPFYTSHPLPNILVVPQKGRFVSGFIGG